MKHIAFIMDGNRRWAQSKGLASGLGHSAGYKSMLSVVKRCAELGIPYVSFFAWSSENFKRTQDEINNVFNIAREKADLDLDKLMQMNIRFTTMGDITKFPKDLQDKLAHIIKTTKDNTGCTLNLCINYGGRADIVQAVNRAKGPQTEESFEKLLYGTDIPDIDFCVRTSGEQRISNFMLWKLSYAEIWFVKKFWPTVNGKFVDQCVTEYKKRVRRFGGSSAVK
ncbi:MAG: di-trans,poly-cis-decaprenylcistransferase [Christensenellaceae bacterium]|jgi:undecaprenyl diphosphate synthase|nr:di-trans,poly-cis-decaprenylcistransferase [Christensenellaceae bacterium]